MTEREYFIALSSFLPFGPARIKLLTSYFKSAEKVWNTSPDKLLDVGLSKKVTFEFVEYKKGFDFKNYFNQLNTKKIDVVTYDEKNYPENLKDLGDAPLVLYIKGNINSNDTNAVAIVGSRKMTSYGREVTQKLSSELASLGITIISGLAFGVDITAHKSALDAGGRCIAVLASGIDIITPRSNEWLGINIIKSGGAVISEYPPGVIPQRHFFPYRNRIISGMSKAVIVIEGMIKSGTIHTANHAAEQGRTVFAVPGQITSPMSQAPHYLIKNGAKLVTDVKDILEELDLQLKVDKEVVNKIMPSDELEEKIVGVLQNETMHIDEIARTLKLEISSVSAKLTMMELKGILRNLNNGEYKIIS